jgi:hypothetical protein
MTNPHFTIAIAEAHRAESLREARLHRLTSEAGRQSLLTRLSSRRAASRMSVASRPASTAVQAPQAG